MERHAGLQAEKRGARYGFHRAGTTAASAASSRGRGKAALQGRPFTNHPFDALNTCSGQARSTRSMLAQGRLFTSHLVLVASFARGLFRLEQTIAQPAPEMFRSLGISGNERQIDFVILSRGKDQAGSLRSIGDSAYHQRILREIFSESQAAFGEHPFFDPFG